MSGIVLVSAVVSKLDIVSAFMRLIDWWGNQTLNQGTPLLGFRAGISWCLKEKKHVLCVSITKEPGLAWVMRENVPEEMVSGLLSEG